MALLCTETTTSVLSPSVYAAASFNSPNRSLRTENSCVASPPSVSCVMPLASSDQPVERSGNVNVSVALPSAPVTTAGFQ